MKNIIKRSVSVFLCFGLLLGTCGCEISGALSGGQAALAQAIEIELADENEPLSNDELELTVGEKLTLAYSLPQGCKITGYRIVNSDFSVELLEGGIAFACQ